MKRISILALCLIQSLFNCVDNDQRDKAHIKADELMKNLVEQNSEKYFPEKYFPREQLRPVLLDLKMNCDYANKNGKFVDSFYASIPGNDKVSFIYEYFMRCDSLRFVLTYVLKEDPELLLFKFEPIETENIMILDKSKQLMH